MNDISRYFLVTLGCFRNEVDSDLIRSELNRSGLREVSSCDYADLIVVNTCGFIADACSEGIDTILELDNLASLVTRRPPILVVGCMSQRYGLELLEEIPEIGGILGADWQSRIHSALRALADGRRFAENVTTPKMPCVRRTVDSSDNATLFVRIADGCDRKCLFCTIPSIRGPYRSRGRDEICEEIRDFTSQREREVVLVAQDLTSYGSDLPERTSLTELVRMITEIDGVRWLRLLYLQPEGINGELIHEMVTNERVCDYFDIPFQHASQTALKRMGRSGDSHHFLDMLDEIRSVSPGAAIRTTLMVGYPGETVSEFEELIRFMKEARFDWLGGFVFSAEEGTEAASLPGQVPSDVAFSRYNKMLETQESVEESSLARFLGRRLEVVIDGFSELGEYQLIGRSYREAPVVDGVIYLRAKDESRNAVLPASFTEAVIKGQEGLDLVGEI